MIADPMVHISLVCLLNQLNNNAGFNIFRQGIINLFNNKRKKSSTEIFYL